MYCSILKNNPLRLYDVTMRHGLQSISKIYSSQEKLQMIENIIIKKKPDAIEIGSFVSPKLIPQLANSLELFREANSVMYTNKPLDIFVVTPTIKSVELAAKHDVLNYSFVTSLSNPYQQKINNKTIHETKEDITHMINTIDNSCDEKKIKLYVSCFSYCPIIGKLNNDMIVNEVVTYYHKYNTIHDICLTDTCGSLQFNDFKYIVDRLDENNVEFNRFSLHLQKQYNHQNIKNIICYAMKIGISSFNVSNISSIDLSNMSNTSNMSNMSTYEMVGNIEYDNIYECL